MSSNLLGTSLFIRCKKCEGLSSLICMPLSRGIVLVRFWRGVNNVETLFHDLAFQTANGMVKLRFISGDIGDPELPFHALEP
uniref:Uncharacterized protein n=1 Tax=Trichuris muris TaxID=70415 RepID=A0A5S6Q0Q4_TRIMR